MAFCPKCGKEVSEEFNVCPNCGNSLSMGGEREMEKEHVILHEKKANLVRIDPKGGRGRKFSRDFSWIVGGELLRRRLKSKFAKTVGETGLEPNDIKDLTDRWRKHVSITLTNENLILTWKQGYITKKNKAFTLPLMYMSSVEKRGILDKPVCIDFEIPSEDKSDSIMFTLKILFTRYRWGGREKQETWMNELRRIKAQI